MQISVQESGKTVLAKGDIASGWRKLTNTFGFCEEARMEMPGDRVLRVQASIRAWPNIFGSRLRQYPENVFGLVKADWGRIELRAQELDIRLELIEIQARRLKRSGLPGIYQEPIEIDKQNRIGFWLSLLVVLSESVHTDYPDIVEWDTQFLAGGRPGGSRRH
jgi:hypothetical protein